MMADKCGRLVTATLLIAVGLACGGGRDGARDEAATAPKPVTVLIDTIIDGAVLRQPLRNPFAVAVDFRGAVYVSDAGNHRIISFTSRLEPLGEAGGYGGAPGLLNRPGFISVDNALNILVADRGNSRLCRFNTRMQFVDEISLIPFDDPGRFGQPSGVALTDHGEIWMADLDKDRIALFDNTNRFDRFIAEFGYSGGQVSSPQKIIPDGYGGFLICDAGNSRVSRYDRFGNFSGAFGQKSLRYPVSAIVDRSYRVWVIDRDVPGLFCFDQRGGVLFELVSSFPGFDGSFADVSDLAILSDGRLVLCDSRNNRLIVGRIVFESE